MSSIVEKFNRLTFLEIVYPVLVGLSFLWIYSYTFNSNLNLGGDNAAYYLLGKALSNGLGYSAIQSSDTHAVTHFPPGYPLLIGLEMLTISDSVTAVKYLNGAFLLLSAFTLFALVKNFSQNIHLAFVSTLFLFANFHLLQYSSIMMSEIPYLFFSLLILYQLTKIDFSVPFYTNKRFLITVALLIFSFHVRTIGFSLFAAVVLYLLTQKRWAYALVTTAAFFVLITPWQMRNKQYSDNSYVKQLLLKNPYHPDDGLLNLTGFVERVGSNISRYVSKEIPHGLMPFFSVNYKEDSTITDYLVGSALILAIIAGLWLIKNKTQRNVLAFYIVGTAGILIIWPEVWNGIRFFLPLIPLFIFLILNTAHEALSFVLSKLKIKTDALPLFLVTGLIFFFSTVKVLHAQKKANYLDSWQNYFQVANYVKRELPDSAIVICRKPALFYLKAERHVSNYKFTANEEEFFASLDEHKATHVVIDRLGYSSTGKYLIPVVQKHPDKFPIIQHLKEPDTYLCEYKKDNGYSGEYKEDKKEGSGTYRYSNGTIYEGEWVNDLREGKGTFTFKTGDQYIGEWKNNVRDGYGILTTQNGVYQGNWINDRFWGQGEYKWNNGYYYKGEWQDGKRHGQGVFRQNGTLIYQGAWENDRPK